MRYCDDCGCEVPGILDRAWQWLKSLFSAKPKPGIGTNIYTDKVSKDIVRMMANKLSIANSFTRDFQESIDGPIGGTISVQKPTRKTAEGSAVV